MFLMLKLQNFLNSTVETFNWNFQSANSDASMHALVTKIKAWALPNSYLSLIGNASVVLKPYCYQWESTINISTHAWMLDLQNYNYGS